MDLNTSRLECSVAPSQNTCLCLPQHTSTRFGAMDHNPPSIPAVDAVCPINDNPSPNSTQGEDNTHAGNGGGKGGMQPEEDKREPEEVQEAPVEVQEEVQVAVDPPIMEDEDESEVVEAPPPTTPPATTSPSTLTGSADPGDNIGKASTGCSDPMVAEMVAMDTASRDQQGLGPLQCDDALSAMAVEHSKSQCECVPTSNHRFPNA